jgi:ABC-type transporter Mla maintaining outer membrane lipid asymmetry ATPase subunit MlaF
VTERPPHVVELRGVKLDFPDKRVLNDVSLKVEPLDRLVIMGQSGSGKSTILRLILGILQPTEGEFFSSNSRSRALSAASSSKCALKSEWSINIQLCSARAIVRDNVRAALGGTDPQDNRGDRKNRR